MENVSVKELLLLLRGSSKAGTLAANALSDGLENFNDVSDLFHDLITCLLVDRDWNCRTNSAKALSCICNKYNNSWHAKFKNCDTKFVIDLTNCRCFWLFSMRNIYVCVWCVCVCRLI